MDWDEPREDDGRINAKGGNGKKFSGGSRGGGHRRAIRHRGPFLT